MRLQRKAHARVGSANGTGGPPVRPCTAAHANRRDALMMHIAGITLGLLGSTEEPAVAADGGLTPYVPPPDKTPALRAGTIKPEDRYSFAIPAGFKEARIAGAQTGNFCQPRCAEPWTEAIFEGKEGKVVLMVVPLVKLTNAKNVSVTDLGTPEQLLQRIGSYITGADFDPEAVLSSTFQRRDDQLQYLLSEVYNLNALTGPRLLSAFTTKGEVAYLFVVSATDRQWSSSERTLREVLASFRA